MKIFACIILLIITAASLVGCSSGAASGTPVATPTQPNPGIGTSLPANPVNVDGETDPRQTNVPATLDTTQFYFSYDDSSSTAGADLSKHYIENGFTPSTNWGRPYEFLNSETFEHFDAQTMGPFQVSIGLKQSEPSDIPLIDQTQLPQILSLGINISGPTLTKEQRPNIVATLLLDVSGSMDSKYADETRTDIVSLLDVAKHGLKTLSTALKPGDVVNLVTFDSRANVLLENWYFTGNNGTFLQNAVANIVSGGSTNLDAGINLAYKVAQRTYDPDKSNRVIILTDALANTGQVDPSIIARNTVINGREGIYFAGVGIGETFNEAFLNELTDRGKGNYAAMVSPNDAERIFSSGFVNFIDAAAKDVRFRLNYPDSLKHLIQATATEEISLDPDAVQPTHFSFNTQQFFIEHFSTETIDPDAVIEFEIQYEDESGMLFSETANKRLGDILNQGERQIEAAAMVTALSFLVAKKVSCSQVQNSTLFLIQSSNTIFNKYKDLINGLCMFR